MNRRGFLAALAGAMVLDPERLLWKPGTKLISVPRIPPPELWGIAYYYVSGNAGPGKFSTPNVNQGGHVYSPIAIRPVRVPFQHLCGGQFLIS